MGTVEPVPANSTNELARSFQFSLAELFWLVGGVYVLGGVYSWLGVALMAALLSGVAWLGAWVLAGYLLVTRRRLGAVIVMSVGWLVGALLLPAVQMSRETPRSAICARNLKYIALALMQYESAHGSLPPPYISDANGKPMHSWRMLILPYLEKDDLYQRYDFTEPWDGPNNRLLHNEVVKLYRCPGCGFGQPPTETNYVAVVGPETMWPAEKATSLSTAAKRDGTSNTLLLVEVHGSGIHWMEPRDLDYTTMPMAVNSTSATGISSPHPSGRHRGLGANVVFADGRTEWFENDTPAEEVRALLTVNGGEKIPAR